MSRMLLASIGLVALAASAVIAQSPAEGEVGSVSTSARFLTELPASSATLTLRTRGSGDTPAESARRNAVASSRMRAALQAVGIPGDSIITRGFSTSLEVDREFRDSSYVTVHVFRVSTRRLDLLAGLVDAALTTEAAEIADISFAADGTERAYLEALKAATEIARRRAAALAEAAGGRLGHLISTGQSNVSGNPDRLLDGPNAVSLVTSERRFTQIQAPIINVGASVVLRYQFIPVP